MKSAQRESLFDPVPSTVDLPRVQIAPENWSRILGTLPSRECEVLLALYQAIENTGYESFTGMELAEHAGISAFNTRPRLCGLDKKRLVQTLAKRPSRVIGEAPSHPYQPNPEIPKAAILRWRETIRRKA